MRQARSVAWVAMMKQRILPDMVRRPSNPPTPESLKREGIERALVAERSNIRLFAIVTLERLAASYHEFTADDIAEAWERAGVTFHHPNVAGGVIQAALKAGVMVRTGRYVPSTRASRRSSMVAVYMAVKEVAA